MPLTDKEKQEIREKFNQKFQKQGIPRGLLKYETTGGVDFTSDVICDYFLSIIEEQRIKVLEGVERTIEEQLLRKARITDYADRTEYDEAYEIVKRIITKAKGV